MDKVTPKDAFQANRDRAAPLLAKLKAEGIGRDGGDYSFDFYMETKHVSLAKGTHRIQKLGV
jgi:acyl-CoA reductase-like NAD-dependent aldehyde dehydrogenase